MSKQATIEQLAKKHLFIDTLQSQNSDDADFHDVSCWGVESALSAAYDAGAESKQSVLQAAEVVINIYRTTAFSVSDERLSRAFLDLKDEILKSKAK